MTCNSYNSYNTKATYSPNITYKFRCLRHSVYYHLCSTVKRERFFAHVYFSNETVSQTTVSTGPMKMFCLDIVDSRLSAYGGVGIEVSSFCYKNTCIKNFG